MQKKLCHNNLLNSENVFHHSEEFLHRKSEGITSVLNSPIRREKSCGANDSSVPGERIKEDYDGNRNIFSISSGPAGDIGEEEGDQRCQPHEKESDSSCLETDVIKVVTSVRRRRLKFCIKMMFNEFCETTGLHGWKYLTRVSSQ